MQMMSEVLTTTQFISATNLGLQNDFRKAQFRGWVSKIKAIITNNRHNLQDMVAIMQGKAIHNCRYTGGQSVCIDQIKGSEGRCGDFDQDFNPLKSHNRDRWIGVASAFQQSIRLPAVELIKIGDVYVVRDGHHRISVAKFRGCDFIDAHVTEWTLEN